MNWKLIFQLSLFGLAMAVATVFVIPSNIEPVVWLVIFAICAYIIARQLTRLHFVHGLLVSMVNSIWITAAHVLLFHPYIAGHAREAAMMDSTPLVRHPRVLMLIMGPIAGIISGVILGLFAFIASRFVKPASR